MDIASTKMTNTIATYVSIKTHNQKVRYKIDCYILDTDLLVIKTTIDNYYYLLLLCKTYKIMHFKKFLLKIVRVIISIT